MEDNKSKAFMKFLSDPSEIINSTKFSIATASAQFFGLIVFAIIGASISMRFQGFSDLLNPDYWITVVVMFAEQLYAYNIGYGLGRALMLNANEELAKTNAQIKAIVEGAKDEQGNELIAPLKRDSAYIDQACQELSDADKIELVSRRMREIIKTFESELEFYKALKKKSWFWPKRIKIGRKRVFFWRRATAIAYCEKQVTQGTAMLQEKESILAVPDKNVAGFQRLEYANLLSSQQEIVIESVSKYHQRSEEKAKAKMAGKKAITKFIMASIGGSILFGALVGSQAWGMVVYTIFLMIVQVANGFKFGSDNVVSIVLYNALNRLKALQDIRKILPDIKSREKKIEVLPETNTSDILPSIVN